jgi:hypothetical protein
LLCHKDNDVVLGLAPSAGIEISCKTSTNVDSRQSQKDGCRRRDSHSAVAAEVEGSGHDVRSLDNLGVKN